MIVVNDLPRCRRGSVFGADRLSDPTPAHRRPSLPDWIGAWLAKRVEPHPGTHICFVELEADFRSCGQAAGPYQS